MYYNDDFMNYMGYRDSEIQSAADQCAEAIRNGCDSVTIDTDLTSDEVKELEREIRKRLSR